MSSSPVAANRRSFLFGAAGTASLLGLSACGVNAESEGGDDVETRKIETDNGTVAVPVDPQRVIAVENWTAYMLVDLGVVPIGIADGTLNEAVVPPDVYEQLKGAITIGAMGEPNAQAIGVLEPDLIIDQFYTEQSAPLSTIAPVVFYHWLGDIPWDEQIDRIADAVNRPDALSQAKEDYAQRIEAIKAAYAEQLESKVWGIVSGGPNGTYYLGSPLATVLRSLGATLISALPEDEVGFLEKSYEELDLLEECDVIVHPVMFDGSYPAPTQELLDNAVWKGLGVVASGNAHPFAHYSVGTYRWANGALDEIEAILKGL
ncbi:ABC transporter substrate-binding protein [Glycomyces sp. NRRL B-16210]|uniref:ABC transporter substrate-binding protein n=1 Tax=Glycomyces sp. NRRL B-16210 TaxID=1463821 RepID=UPI000B07FC30|nr:ABC transporter substrate-binding protein [Glycomyces sp. NRRL B-16210]